MPIYLHPPEYDPAGPDGKGRNRLRIEWWGCSAQCALLPKTARKLVHESQDTRLAHWGYFGVCNKGPGQCSYCDVSNQHTHLPFTANRFAVRIDDDNNLVWVMNRLDKGWGEFGYPFRLPTIARCENYYIEGRRIYRDEHSEYFFIRRVA